MAACQECDQKLMRHRLHTDDDPADLGDGLVAQASHPIGELPDGGAVRRRVDARGHGVIVRMNGCHV